MIAEGRRERPTVENERAPAASSSISNSWMVEKFRRLTTNSRSRPEAAEAKLPVVLAIKGPEEKPKIQEVRAEVVKPLLALKYTAGDMTYLGGCSMNFLNGNAAQDAVILEIQRSSV